MEATDADDRMQRLATEAIKQATQPVDPNMEVHLMLNMLNQVAMEGTLRLTEVYLGHIKRDEDRKYLAHAEAQSWNDADPAIRGLLEQYLYQAIEGKLGEVNFPCMYTDDLLSVEKVASSELDRTRNIPTVEILEIIRDVGPGLPERLVEWGNLLAYKIMAAGAIKNHLVAVIRFEVVPAPGRSPVPFVFATMCDLNDREDSLFDELMGCFVIQTLNNVVKRGSVSRAVLFPCLDGDGREMADMLVYASSAAGAWFAALEATRRLSPKREGQALVRMIAEQTAGAEVSHDLFSRMGSHLHHQGAEGMNAQTVVDSLERAVGYGVDRKGFLSRWESTFGDLGYRPAYQSLFGTEDGHNPTRLKMQAGDIQINLPATALARFRQVTTADGETFIAFRVPERAKVVVGKDLDLKVSPVSHEDLGLWVEGFHGE